MHGKVMFVQCVWECDTAEVELVTGTRLYKLVQTACGIAEPKKRLDRQCMTVKASRFQPPKLEKSALKSASFQEEVLKKSRSLLEV